MSPLPLIASPPHRTPYQWLWHPRVRFIVGVVAISLVIGAMALWLRLHFAPSSVSQETLGSGWLQVWRLFKIVALAPAIETTMLVIVIAFAQHGAKALGCDGSTHSLSVMGGCVMGALHGFVDWIQTIPATASFILYSVAYLRYRVRSRFDGWLMAFLPHAIQNFIAVVIILGMAFIDPTTQRQ